MKRNKISEIILKSTSLFFITVVLTNNAYSAGWNIEKRGSKTYAKLKPQGGYGGEAVFRCVGKKTLAVAFEINPPYSGTERRNYTVEFSKNEKFETSELLDRSVIFIEISSDKLFDALINNYSFKLIEKESGSDRTSTRRYSYSSADIYYSWRDILQSCELLKK